MGHEPIKALEIKGALKDMVEFDEWELRAPNLFCDGPAYDGNIEWHPSSCGYSVPESAEGVFKLRKIWQEVWGDADQELYEGFWSVEVVYGSALEKRGHEWGKEYEARFWAIPEKQLETEDEDSEAEASADNIPGVDIAVEADVGHAIG